MIFNVPQEVTVAGTTRTHTFDSTGDVIAFAKNEVDLWSGLIALAKQFPQPAQNIVAEQGAFYGNLAQVAEALDAASLDPNQQGQSSPLQNLILSGIHGSKILNGGFFLRQQGRR